MHAPASLQKLFRLFDFFNHVSKLRFQRHNLFDEFLLNLARAGRRPARTWFLKIDPVRIVCMCMCVCVCVCVCVSAPEAINN